MADIADIAGKYEEQLRAHGLANRPRHLNGEALCLKCGDDNDRAREGYGVCSDCVADD